MTKARDISSLIGSSGQIDNTKITLDANEIPNLDANKIATGSLGADRIPNLSADKITSGTFADARISQSSVSQHATSFDDNKIVNDISTLALRQASDANRGAYNTNSQSVDVFQDDTGIDTTTNAIRNASEYVSSVSSVITDTSVTIDHNNYSTYFNTNTVHNTHNDTDFNRYDTGRVSTTDSWENLFFNGGDSTFFRHDNSPRRQYQATWFDFGSGNSFQATNVSYYFSSGQGGLIGNFFEGYNTLPTSTTAQPSDAERYINRTGNPAVTNGSNISSGSMTGNNFNRYFSYLAQFGANQDNYTNINDITLTGTFRSSVLQLQSTGNFTGTTITAPSSVSEMGAIITYQDQAGTNALNTDIVLQLSADGGSNYSTATLTALPDFSTGIKMAKVNDLAVTAGTQLKYKISFANQASGSKEARIRGVALQY